MAKKPTLLESISKASADAMMGIGDHGTGTTLHSAYAAVAGATKRIAKRTLFFMSLLPTTHRSFGDEACIISDDVNAAGTRCFFALIFVAKSSQNFTKFIVPTRKTPPNQGGVG